MLTFVGGTRMREVVRTGTGRQQGALTTSRTSVGAESQSTKLAVRPILQRNLRSDLSFFSCFKPLSVLLFTVNWHLHTHNKDLILGEARMPLWSYQPEGRAGVN